MEGEKNRSKSGANVQNERKSEDVNCNTNSSILGKRKKRSDKKRWVYLQEWLDNSQAFQKEAEGLYGAAAAETMNFTTPPSFYWPAHPAMPVMAGQRLFSASDPSVCHYPLPSVPLNYSVEPISLPLYSLYPPMPNPAWRQGPQAQSLAKGLPTRRPKVNPPSQPTNNNSGTWTVPGQNTFNCHNIMDTNEDGVFISLPTGPETPQSIPEHLQRRFSDPGLGPSDSGVGPSDTGTGSRDRGIGPSDPGLGASDSDSSDDSWTPTPDHSNLVTGLLEQVSTLYISNRRLARALRNTRSELQTLKLESSTWSQSEYQPGILAELIRDVREASRVRLEALMTRVDNVLGTSPTKPTVRNPEIVDQRLLRIEEQLHSLVLPNCELNGPRTSVKVQTTEIDHGGDYPAQPLVDTLRQNDAIDQNSQQEVEKLQRELQVAVQARHEAEARTQKLEQLLCVLREKINVLSGKEKQTTPSENSPEESLTSLSSCGSPQLTMSGPVTCL